MVTHNGERYLEEQLGSMGDQTVLPNKMIVVDDASNDRTLRIVRSFAKSCPFKVTLVDAPIVRTAHLSTRIGQNFAYGLSLMRDVGVILLADQDDVWLPWRVECQLDTFRSEPSLMMVSGDADLIDSPSGETRLSGHYPVPPGWSRLSSEDRFQAVLMQSVATGACSAIRQKLLELALPIPRGWLHDRWLSIVAASVGGFDIQELAVIRYRIHDGQSWGTVGDIYETRASRIRRIAADPVVNVRKTISLAKLEAKLEGSVSSSSQSYVRSMGRAFSRARGPR
jgi:hypothetical protein